MAQPTPQDPLQAPPSWEASEPLEAKYGGVSGALKAGAAGALRGATLGLSDPFLVKTGIASARTLKGLQAANPEVSIGSEFAGTFAPAAIGEEGSLANLPGLVSKLGRGVEAGALESLPIARSTLGKMAVSGTATGAGLATEGAIYGLGNSISESALGDHDLVSEKTLANIGLSSALAGGFGTVVGSALGALGKDLGTAEQKIAAQKGSAGLNPDATNMSDMLPAKEKLSFIKALQEQKENAQEIKDAGEILGAPVLPGQTSKSKFIQDLTSSISQAPTIPGIITQRTIQKGFDAIDNVMKQTLGSAEHLTPYEAGSLIKGQILDRFDSSYGPFKELYAQREALTKDLGISDKDSKGLYDSLVEKSQNYKNATNPGRSVIYQAANDVLKEATETGGMKNLDEYAKSIGNLARQSFSQQNPDLGHAYNLIKESVETFRDNQFLKYGKELSKAGVEEGLPEAKKVIEEYSQLKKQYAEFKGMMNDFVSDVRLGKRAVNESGLNEMLEKIPNEKILDRMFDPKNADGLARLKKNFPDVFQTMAQQKKSQILQSSLSDDRVQVGKAMRQIYDESRLSSKARETLFSPEELKKLDAAKTWVESMPKDINPSGTSKGEAFKEFWTHPIKTTATNLASYVGKKIIDKFAGNPLEAAKVMTLVNTERQAIKTSERIANGIDAMFGQAKKVTTAKAFSKIASPDEYKEETDNIKKIANNVGHFSDVLAQNTEGLHDHAPNIAMSSQMAMARGIQFLNSKIPPQQVGFFEKDLTPSQSEISQFARYYNLVQDPVSALDQVKDGTITAETNETLNAVFPKLYGEMKAEMISGLSKVKDPSSIPFGLRVAMSQFLEQPLDQALSPQAIMANQVTMNIENAQQAQKDQMGTARPSKSGMNKITVAKRTSVERPREA